MSERVKRSGGRHLGLVHIIGMGGSFEQIAREMSWSFLELPGLGEGQMLAEHPDGESEIEYFGE